MQKYTNFSNRKPLLVRLPVRQVGVLSQGKVGYSSISIVLTFTPGQIHGTRNKDDRHQNENRRNNKSANHFDCRRPVIDPHGSRPHSVEHK